DLLRILLVGDVGDHDVRFVCHEADFVALVALVRALVDDALGVVGVAVAGAAGACDVVAADEGRCFRLADVDHVQPASAAVGAAATSDGVGEAGLLIDDDVVGATDAVVRRARRKRGGRTRDAAELGEVEDLNAVRPRVVGDDEGVIGVYLDVTPDAVVCARRWGQTSYEQGVRGLGHVDEGGAVGTPDQCV